MNVLVVDDDPLARARFRDCLRAHDAQVYEASDLRSVVVHVRELRFDAILISWLARARAGGSECASNAVEVCREVRREGETARIWMYTPVALSPEAVVLAVEAGADDIIESSLEATEPFVRRICAMSRRLRSERDADLNAQPLLSVGDIIVDRSARTATASGRSIHLSLSEFELLAYLATSGDRAVPHDELFRNVLGGSTRRARHSNALTMLVRRLRAKLGAAGASVESVRSFGYRLSARTRDTPSQVGSDLDS